MNVSVSHWGLIDAPKPTKDDDLAYLDVPYRVYRALTQAGYTRTWQIEPLSTQQLLKIKGIGVDAARRIRGELRKRAVERAWTQWRGRGQVDAA